MGQAKKRGDLDTRIKQAQTRNKIIERLGGKTRIKRYFDACKENKAIMLKSDDEVTDKEAIKFTENEDLMKRFREDYENAYEHFTTDTKPHNT